MRTKGASLIEKLERENSSLIRLTVFNLNGIFITARLGGNPSGCLAQRESIALTRRGSEVRTL